MKTFKELSETTTEEFIQTVNGGKALLIAKKLKEEGNDFTSRLIIKSFGLDIHSIGTPYEFVEREMETADGKLHKTIYVKLK